MQSMLYTLHWCMQYLCHFPTLMYVFFTPKTYMYGTVFSSYKGGWRLPAPARPPGIGAREGGES